MTPTCPVTLLLLSSLPKYILPHPSLSIDRPNLSLYDLLVLYRSTVPCYSKVALSRSVTYAYKSKPKFKKAKSMEEIENHVNLGCIRLQRTSAERGVQLILMLTLLILRKPRQVANDGISVILPLGP